MRTRHKEVVADHAVPAAPRQRADRVKTAGAEGGGSHRPGCHTSRPRRQSQGLQRGAGRTARHAMHRVGGAAQGRLCSFFPRLSARASLARPVALVFGLGESAFPSLHTWEWGVFSGTDPGFFVRAGRHPHTPQSRCRVLFVLRIGCLTTRVPWPSARWSDPRESPGLVSEDDAQ